MKTIKTIVIPILFTILGNSFSLAQTECLPLIQICSLEYQGAFIIPGSTHGESNANYMAGPIEFNPSNNSMFVSGHNVHGGLAEFSIPPLINSETLSDLNTATALQDFRRILNETPDGNPQNINRITGLKLFNNKLIVNALDFYDAAANNTHTSLVIEDATDIANSAISGYYELEGAAHIAGWMSPVPAEWQGPLGGNWISGNSSRYSINGRLPMGPTAFIFDPNDLNGSPSGIIPTTTLLDYDLADPLYADYSSYSNANYNVIEVNGSTPSGHTFEDADAIVGMNDLWTEESFVGYGLIIPGTRTYLTVGSSGGHHSGIGYKATQNNGNLCGGPCAYDADDYYNYYWLWDVNDLLDVKNGLTNPYDVRPYAHGIFDVPFQFDEYTSTPEYHPIVGGTYDPDSGLIYLTIYDGASTGAYQRIPVIAAYRVKSKSLKIKSVLVNDSLFTKLDTISTSGTVTVANGHSIILEGTRTVMLNPGFNAQTGCDFIARIGSSCINFLEVNDIQMTDSLFSGHDTILTSGTVTVVNGNSIVFQGAEVVLLNQGFSAQSGGHFIAKISDEFEICPTVTARPPYSSNTRENLKIEPPDKSISPIDLGIYPNPFYDYATITFSLQKQEKAQIGLYDVSGREMMTWFNGMDLTAGKHEIILNGSALNAGLYYVRLRTESEIKVEKLVLQKQ